MSFANSCLPTVVDLHRLSNTFFCMQNPRVDGVKRTPKFSADVAPNASHESKNMLSSNRSSSFRFGRKDKKWGDFHMFGKHHHRGFGVHKNSGF